MRGGSAADGEIEPEVFGRKKDIVDVVLLDLSMPKMPGKTVLERLLEIQTDVKVAQEFAFAITSRPSPKMPRDHAHMAYLPHAPAPEKPGEMTEGRKPGS